MNKLVTILTVAALALGMSMSAMAQQPGPKGGEMKRGPAGQRQPGGRFMGRMADAEKEIFKKLKLNAAQQKKIDALNKSTKTKVEALMKAPGDMRGKREKFRAINTDRRTQLGKILTPAQLKQYKELWDAKMKEMRPPGPRPGERGGPMPPKGGPAKGAGKGKA